MGYRILNHQFWLRLTNISSGQPALPCVTSYSSAVMLWGPAARIQRAQPRAGRNRNEQKEVQDARWAQRRQ
jgi:hypothetical protein